MKTLQKFIIILILLFSIQTHSKASENIKIGLIVPLTGEYSEIGKSILNATRLALNSIDDSRFEILPRDNQSDPELTLKVSRDLYFNDNVEIILGPLFNNSTKYLDKIPEVTFVSFTNKLKGNHSNVISSGVNAVSQIKAIKKFKTKKGLERTIFLIPNSDFKLEIESAIAKTQIKIKDKFTYDTDPTLLTSQIEKITNYPRRKQNLLDEITRVEDSDDPNKEKIIKNLEKKDTIGGINFDSVVIADFDENLKSVTTSLLYSDVSSKRVSYISLNQWFDDTLLKETSLQPLYFPSINKKNYENFEKEYFDNFRSNPNQISFLSYDLTGLIYYLLYKNNFEVDKKIFYKKNKFLGKIGVFEINKNIITHELSFYSVEENNFKKIF